MKKVLFGVVVTCAMCFTNVMATENDSVNKYFCDDGAIGLSFDVKTNNELTLMILNDGAVWDENMWTSQGSNDIVYMESNIPTDGKYNCNFVLNNCGKYNALLKNSENKTVYSFMYSKREDSEQAVEEIKNAIKNNEDITTLIDKYYDTLLISTDLYVSGDTASAQIVSEYLKNNDVNNPEEMSSIIEKAYLLKNVNSGNAKVGDYMYSAGIYDNSEKYILGHENEFRNELNLISGVDSIEKFEDKIDQTIVLSTIKYSSNTQLINYVLNEYYEKIGINKNDISVGLCNSLNKKIYNSYEELKKAVENYKKDADSAKDKTPSSGGGSSGGNSSGGGSSNGSLTSIGVMQGGTSTAKKEIFSDIDDVPWAKEAIEGLYHAGIVSGKSDDLFYPQDKVLREEFTKMIIELFDLNVIGKELSFIDIDNSQWYYKYIKSAYNAEIINGQSEDYFGIGQNITRQDLVVMVCRGLNKCGISVKKSNDAIEFKDIDDIANYAVDAVNLMSSAGVISGNNGYFYPREFATRAEAAKIIYSVMKMLD